jgi:glycosyltransferase involved in cell wall biosynthesis
VARYRDIFAGSGAEFIFVPWGAHMPSAAEIVARVGPLPPAGGTPELVSAGRSGRDYPTLAAAVEGLACRLTIICNEVAGLGAVIETDNLRILRDCFLHEYMWHLLRADIVVVPLRVDDISAGQMVMIQGMALGRALIVTRTPTVEEYLQDGFSALLVPRGDAVSLQAAIRRLMADTALVTMLGRNARREYEMRFSGEAHLRALVAAVERHCGIPGSLGVALAS